MKDLTQEVKGGKFGGELGPLGKEVEGVLRNVLADNDGNVVINAKGLITLCKSSDLVSEDIKKVLSQRTPSVCSTLKRVAKEYNTEVQVPKTGPAFQIQYTGLK